MYHDQHLDIDFQYLLQKSEKALIFFNELEMSAKEAETIEELTRGQSNVKVGFEQRAGRVTASKFKKASETNPDKPAS